ncbi:hypothetical protein Aph02nite_91300 [Actinoplanes philippinensis]|uniref:Uncharacterized protein n=1 Tax=Actinoplanes philippinensis TaxID=35752 RepID=A0A1I2MW80_9ACTN|nr:hypothetical protein [Actinoplanes philippinensis]GIE83180.1 hypothetical protein Aph02nite_91300 [Actinoplanes philippinensis]SFF93596.1 hypothetical protein SAMN05421541_13247 [Actinoplanes philippinensis]
MTQMTFPVAFPTARRATIATPAGQPRWMVRGVEFATVLAVSLGADPAVVHPSADRGVIVAGPRVAAAPPTSWITAW